MSDRTVHELQDAMLDLLEQLRRYRIGAGYGPSIPNEIIVRELWPLIDAWGDQREREGQTCNATPEPDPDAVWRQVKGE